MIRTLLLLTCAAFVIAAQTHAGSTTSPINDTFGRTLSRISRSVHKWDRTGNELNGAQILPYTLQSERVGRLLHLWFDVRTGTGDYDRIRIHRVVSLGETGGRIAPPRAAVFMIHGAFWGFEGAFLSSVRSRVMTQDHSLGIYLAGRGIDVWGIDLRWTLVPLETQDLTFMKDWGNESAVRDVTAGLAIARAFRDAEGTGKLKLHLLGWSNGGFAGYSYILRESQYNDAGRHVDGFIPLDTAFLFRPGDTVARQAACLRAEGAKNQINSGTLYSEQGKQFWAAGGLAAWAPQDRSPLDARFTNRELALLGGAATHTFFAPGQALVPSYHFHGGPFDEAGLPQSLTYTSERYFYENLQRIAPYSSLMESFERDRYYCEEADEYVPQLKNVTVPVLYVGAAGGFGSHGEYSTEVLGSWDITRRVVSLEPGVSDFGHADLLFGDRAPAEVWSVILGWIHTH